MKVTDPQRRILSWVRKNPKENKITQERETGIVYYGSCTIEQYKTMGQDGTTELISYKPTVIGGIIKQKTFMALLNKKLIKEDLNSTDNKLLKYWTLV